MNTEVEIMKKKLEGLYKEHREVHSNMYELEQELMYLEERILETENYLDQLEGDA